MIDAVRNFALMTLLGVICFYINAQDQSRPVVPPIFEPESTPSQIPTSPHFSLVFGDEEPVTRSTRPSFFGITFPTKPPPRRKVPDGNLSCYSCRLDFRKGYDSTNPCLGRYGSKLDAEYIVNCGRKDIFCRVERTEVNGMLILLARECVDSCYYGCRPKGFGINFEACAECCNTFACNDFYPVSAASEVVAIQILNAGVVAILAFKGWRRL